MRLRLPGAGHLLPPLPSRPGATGTSLSSSQPPPPLTAPAALADTGAQRAGATVEPLSPCGSQTHGTASSPAPHQGPEQTHGTDSPPFIDVGLRASLLWSLKALSLEEGGMWARPLPHWLVP